MKPLALSIAIVASWTSIALAEPSVRVEPRTVRPGDPVLVVVSDVNRAPVATVGGKELDFFRTRRGYQAVFAVPIEDAPDTIRIRVRGVEDAVEVDVDDRTFPETEVVVEDELANPPAAERERVDADNKAMIAALNDSKGAPQFTRTFVRPKGGVTSPFGEWRTFNDGHRSQHLGLDVFAKTGAKVHAINRGTVTFVGDTYLGGNVVVITHGAGIASAYMHLSETSVAVGDVIDRGTVLGKAGETGRATGPHLHVAVRVHGGFVDPERFFKLKLGPVQPERREAAARRRR